MNYRKTFPLYIFLTTAVIGATLLFWGAHFLNKTPTLAYVGIKNSTLGIDPTNTITLYLVSLLVGISMLIPMWLAMWHTVDILSETDATEGIIRFFSGGVGLTVLNLIAYIFVGDDIFRTGLACCYMFPLVWAVSFFKLSSSNEVQTELHN